MTQVQEKTGRVPVALKESEIRPDDLMAGQASRYASDVARLLTRRSEFVDVNCPACDSGRSTKAFEKYELSYLRCSTCATIYISPRPSSEVLDEYYRTSENYAYWNKYIFPASEEARREKIFRPRVDRLLEMCDRHGVRRGTLMEVGAGFGTFAHELKSRGAFARVIAVEPTPDLAATCRTRGLEVVEAPIEHVSLSSGEQIDAIASFEVIEHLFSPRDFLLQIGRVLSPSGLVVLTCPSAAGFDIQTLGPVSDAVDTEHLNYFTPESLSLLLSRCGFETVEIQTPGKLDAELVRKKVEAGLFSVEATPFLQQVLVDKWEKVGPTFQTFLADNLLSSHLWLAATRVPS